jgi:hypothetical protein
MNWNPVAGANAIALIWAAAFFSFLARELL